VVGKRSLVHGNRKLPPNALVARILAQEPEATDAELALRWGVTKNRVAQMRAVLGFSRARSGRSTGHPQDPVNDPRVATKRCSHCGKVKEADAFNCSRASYDGLQSYCRACNRAYLADRRTRFRSHGELA
jgi:hypothetical protein